MSLKDQNKIRVSIGIPCGSGTVDYRFASSLAALKVPDQTRIVWIPRVMIDTARNLIVEKTLEDLDYTHLLFVDDDMVFPSETLEKLLSHDKDIVGVQSFKRREMYEPCVYTLKESKYYPILVNSFIDVDAIGTGILLIKTEVFKKVKFPWFETVYDKDKTHWSVDFMFCRKAKKEGYKLYCDPDIEIGHIGDAPIKGKVDFLKIVEEKANINNNFKPKPSSES